MHYLEDFLEIMRLHLPSEVIEHLTEIEKTDVKVQSNINIVEKLVDSFFSAKDISVAEKTAEVKRIKESYDELLKDADWKIYHAEQLYNIVEKFFNHLDAEIHKFKMELEVDNAGITQILENRVSSYNQPPIVKIKTERKIK